MINKEEIKKAREILSNQISENLDMFSIGNQGGKYLCVAQNNIILLLNHLEKEELKQIRLSENKK